MEPYPIINGDVPMVYTVLSVWQTRPYWRVEFDPGVYLDLPQWVRAAPRVGDTLALFSATPSASSWGMQIRGAALNGVVLWYYPDLESAVRAMHLPPWSDDLLGQVG